MNRPAIPTSAKVPEPEPPQSDAASPEELAAYVRTNLWRALLGILVLSALLVLLGALFEAELISAAQAVYDALGVLGLGIALFITDSVFSPMPPDVLLVVVANSALHAHWPVVLPATGLISAAAGNFGWFLGSTLARVRWAAPFVVRSRGRDERPMRKVDRWAVILGAVTPLPFSLSCISAGALGMPWRRLAPITLLRIPRFVLFYWVVYYSTAG
jgi:membrane protein YqaA with SNARE-associated domain